MYNIKKVLGYDQRMVRRGCLLLQHTGPENKFVGDGRMKILAGVEKLSSSRLGYEWVMST